MLVKGYLQFFISNLKLSKVQIIRKYYMKSIKRAFINGTSVHSACVYKHCFPEAEGAEENSSTADD